MILAFGQWIGWGWYSSTAPELATLADPDWYAVGWILLWLGKLFSGLGNSGIWIVGALVLGITVTILFIANRHIAAVETDPTEAKEAI